MRLFATFIAALLLAPPAHADDVHDVLSLWGAQGGPWTGHIAIYSAGSSEPQTVAITTRWDAVPDYSMLTKIETFTGPDSEDSSVTLMFADSSDGNIVTPYFVKGRQHNYHFAVVSVSIIDETHWTTVIATSGAQEIYEDRPAQLRYLRTRKGNTIENSKEVRFLDDEGSGEYELRSFIRQTRSP